MTAPTCGATCVITRRAVLSLTPLLKAQPQSERHDLIPLAAKGRE